MSELITCECCGGVGTVELPEEYQRTLDKLRRVSFCTTEELREKGVSREAVAMRLFRLEKLGLAKRDAKRHGRYLVWQAVTPRSSTPSPKD